MNRHRRRVNAGEVSVEVHSGKQNQNAARVDRDEIVTWFHEYAATEGEVAPLRRRRREMREGGAVVRYDTELYTLLPASKTWEKIYAQYLLFLDGVADVCYVDSDDDAESASGTQKVAKKASEDACSFSQFRAVLAKDCPLIKIRSRRENVCDICSIYKHRVPEEADALENEYEGRDYGEHVETAKAMR